MADASLKGIGVSAGIASGPARIVEWDFPKVTRRVIPEERIDDELARLHDTVRLVRTSLEALRDQAKLAAGVEEAKIFEAQILMLEDPEFLEDVETLIRENQLSAERSFEFRTLELRALWSQSPNARLRQRVADLNDVQLRVLNELVGRSLQTVVHSDDERPVVVFTRELTPGLTMELARSGVAGVVCEEGTRTSHAAILARSLGIPCVMGLVGGLESVTSGTETMLDGVKGTVLLNPSLEELESASENERMRAELDRRMETVDAAPVSTKDGVPVTLLANIDRPEDLEAASRFGAEGVGLLRTEFFLLGRKSMPNEDEQAGFFERAVQGFPGQPFVVRSYDLGGDKYPMSFGSGAEANPFLGWRAIRVCLDHPSLFRTQIRAMMRGRRHGDLRLMLPLITGLDEVERTRELVAESAEELERQGVAAATDLPVGVMIETPAAAVLADQLAERSDFLSVGTNDLTQYTLAVDRGNARLARRFTPFHPAVLSLLERIANAGQRHGRPASVCGEMASDPMSVYLLLGLGFRVLSVAANALPLIRWFVKQVNVAAAQEVAAQALKASTTEEILALLEEGMADAVDRELIEAGQLPGRYARASFNEPST